jgi:phosphatidylglycerol---prolipoprotein diacylglyceryl transferase
MAAIIDTIGSGFDRMVAFAHRVRWQGQLIHPYFLMSDLGIVAVVLLAICFSATVQGFSFGRFALAFVTTQVVYQGVYLHLKNRLIGERARSFLQDTLLVVLPTWLGCCALLDIPVTVAADFAALSLAAVLAFMRGGCFLGGCCYGVPASWGVLYNPELLRPIDGWRRFTPGPPPGQRVVPIQLFESLLNVLLFGLLGARMIAVGGPDGQALPLYLIGYSAYRFFAEFYRGHRHRPLRGRLSEAQWACLTALLIGVLWKG